mmetsp:Transcript_5990/g.17034  ORF Transcript_5990/g.17034 Transcript_5990/m.17034 type:complete len:656 (+) Transcript_5990:146-2113(+)
MVRFYPLTKTGSKSESSIPRRTQTAIARKRDFRDSVRINAIFRREKLFPTKYGKASGSENTIETNQTTTGTNGEDSTKKTTTTTTKKKKNNTSSRSDPTTTGASADVDVDVDADAIRRANFAGKIPVRLTLARSSLSSATPPHPQHVLVSRHTFLHVGLESAVRELHKYAPQALHMQMHGVHHHGKIVVREEGDSDNDNDKQNEKDKGDDNENNSSSSKANDAAESSSKGPLSAEPESAITPYPVCWFEDVATQQPLRWQYFAGVLFDSLPPTTRTTNSSSTTNASRRQLPWELRLHFRSYPSDTLLELLDPNHGHGTGVLETIQQIYKNSLKQGLVIHHGNAREALNLSKQSHTVLWEEGIRGGSYDAIRPILFPEKKRSNGGADRDKDKNEGKDKGKGKNKGGDNNEHAAKQSSQTAASGSEKVSDSASSEPNAERKEPKDASKRDNRDSSSKDVRDSKDETTVPTEGTNPKTNPTGCSRDNAPDKSVPASANNGNHTGKNDPRPPATIPVRLSLDPTKPMLQKRIGGGGGGACGPSGEDPTLGSLLRGWASPQRNEDIRHHEVRVGGISPPLSTPLVDLWKILRHPDNFLYVCVVPNNTNRGNRNKTHNHKDQEQDHRNGKSSLLVGTPRWKTTIVSSRFSSARRRRRNRKK